MGYNGEGWGSKWEITREGISMSEQFKWTVFYEELATKLLEYKNNRKELIDKVVNVYDSIGMKLPRLETHGIPKDIVHRGK